MQTGDNAARTFSRYASRARRIDEPDSITPDRVIRHGTCPRILTPDHATKVHLVRSGVGWGRLTQAEIEEGGDDLVPLGALCTPLYLQLCMMRSRFRDLGPVGQAIWKAFKARYAKSNPAPSTQPR